MFRLEKSGGGIPAHFITKTEDYAKKCYEKRLEKCHNNMVSEIQGERVLPEVVPIGFRDFDDLV